MPKFAADDAVQHVLHRDVGPGSWVVRCADGKGGAWTQGFSTADDFEDSDNEHVLDFWS